MNTDRLSSVSFFCPAYFDEENLPDLIPKVHQFLSEISNQFEIIIVDDASPDKTGLVADNLVKQYPEVWVIHHQKNQGYGGALKTGFNNARFDYVMYTDGDNQYDVNEFRSQLPFLEEFDILSGYAIKKAVTIPRRFQSFLYNSLVRLLFLVNWKDVNCSMKIYRRQVLDTITIKSNSAFIDTEMLIRAQRAGFKIHQFPVTHYQRRKGLASGSKPRVILDTGREMLMFRMGFL